MKIGIIWTDCVRFAALVGSGGRKKKGWIYVLCHRSHFSPYICIYIAKMRLPGLNRSLMFPSQVSTVNLPQATGQCGALMTRRAH